MNGYIKFATLFLTLALTAPLSAQEGKSPSDQIDNFSTSLLTLGAHTAFKELFSSNFLYKDQKDYVKSLRRHYEWLLATQGELRDFKLLDEKELSKDTKYFKYYSKHDRGNLIWEFQYCFCDGNWLLTEIHFQQESIPDVTYKSSSCTYLYKLCVYREGGLEDGLTCAIDKMETLRGKESITAFVNSDVCHPFIKSFLKIDYLTRNSTNNYFDFGSIEEDISKVDEIDQRMNLWASVGNTALITFGNAHDAHAYASKANVLLKTIKSHTKYSVAGISILAQLYMRLGDSDSAYVILDHIKDKAAKNAIINKLKNIENRAKNE